MASLTAYVRKTGSDTNGGSSASTSPDTQGTDGVTNGTTTFTSAAALFVAGDVDKLIMIGTKNRYRIVGYTNATTVTLSGSPSVGSGLTWKIGGAVATIGATVANLAAAALVGGDKVYIGPGTYRETLTAGWTAFTSEVIFQGDVDGKNTGDAPGKVVWTAYTTNDKTAPSASNVLSIGGKHYVTFLNIMFVTGSANGIATSGTYTHHVTFRDCAFFVGSTSSSTGIGVTSTFANALNWLIDRCLFVGGPSHTDIAITLATGVGADYDADFQIQNSIFLGGGSGVIVSASGSAANKGGGVDIRNCMRLGPGVMISTVATNISTSIPCTITNSFVWGASPCVSAGTSGSITEDYNILIGVTPRTNVTAGTNSISNGSYAPMIHLGQERIWGGSNRPLGEPMEGSPLLGFGNDGTQTALDYDNGLRPAGGVSALPAVGPMERGNTFGKETGTVRTGSNAISITGPGYQEFLVPVDASSTTISVYVRWDATYAGTKPQFQIDANGEIGVSAETKTATGASGSWEQLTLTAFTPTAKGIVKIRVLSNDTNGGGKAFADDFAVA